MLHTHQTIYNFAARMYSHSLNVHPRTPTSFQNLVDYFDKNCAIEKTSLLFVWEGSGKKYNMYAGEEPGEKNTRLIPGRKTRIPSIYNLNYKSPTAPPPPNTLPTTNAVDDAVMSCVFFGFTTLTLIIFF